MTRKQMDLAVASALGTYGTMLIDRNGQYWKTVLRQSTHRLPRLTPVTHSGFKRSGDDIEVRRVDIKLYTIA